MDDRPSDVVTNGEIMDTSEVDSVNSSVKAGKSEDHQVKKYSFNGDINSRVKCTACYRQILLVKPSAVYRHPVLKVLVCKKCYDYYTSGDIKEGEDGVDEQCRWCGDGGKLLGCDYCHNAYCKNCIKTNLGRSELSTITGGGKWRCYVCDPEPLQNLVKYCSAVISAVQSFQDNKVTPGKSSDNLASKVQVASGGRCKETPKKKPASSEADNESSDNSSGDGIDDHRMDVIFSSKNLKQTVEALKSSVTPLYLALAETEDEIKKLSRTSGSRVASKYETLASKLRHKYVDCNKTLARFRKSRSNKPSAVVDSVDKSKKSKSSAAVDINNDTTDSTVGTSSGKEAAAESNADVSELGETAKLSADEGDEVASGSSKKTDGKQPASSLVKPSLLPELKLVRSSRADMDAQRSLHREMLVAGSDDSDKDEDDKDEDDNDSDDDDSSSDDSEQSSSNSSDDLYDPKQERRDMNAELKTERRVSRNKQMSRTAIRQVKAIRDRIKKNKLKKKKNAKKAKKCDSDYEEDKKGRKKKKHGKRDEKDDDDESKKSDDDGKKKKTGKTKKESDRKKEKESKDGEEDDVEDEENGKKKPEKSTKKGKKNGKDEEPIEADKSSPDKRKSVETTDGSKDGKSETKGKSRKEVDEEDKESGVEEEQTGKESAKKAETVKSGADGDSEKGESEEGTNEAENHSEDAAGDADGKKVSKKLDKKQKKSVGKSVDASGESECSTDHDSDLDKELKVLEKVPKLTIKLGGEKDASRKIGEKSLVVVLEKDGVKSKSSKDGKATEDGKDASKAAKAGARRKLIDDLSSAEEDANGDGDDDGVEELEEENEADASKTAEECAGTDAVPMDVGEDDDDAKARKALMDDAEDDIEGEEEAEEEEDEDDGDESDSKAEKKEKQTKKKNVAVIDHDSADDFEEISPIKRKSKKRSKLLRAKISDSDDGDSDEKSTKKKKSSKKKDADSDDDEDDEDDVDEDSDSDIVTKKKKKNKKRKHSSSEEEENSSDDEKQKKGKKHKRRRIKAQSDSSEEKNSGEEGEGGSDDDDDTAAGRKRRKIRKIINTKELSKKTVDAAKAEEERRMRITERQKLFNQVTVEDTSSPIKCQKTLKLVLEVDEETKEPIVEVHKKLICKLKPHQVEAVKFMWNCCIESLERLKKEDGSGCILAHCMGLGKTLSVIAFVHTLLENAKLTKMKTCLVLCPLNTILNWQSEFERWLEDCGQLDVYELSSVKDNWGRSELLNDWQTGGGVMIMGYEMFRNLSQLTRIKNKNQKKIFTETLLNPGPDLIVCDEGHVLKNDSTGLSKATTQIKTKRRIVLTGTPLQNNLVEYHCMVNFVKPNLLGTRKEFCNRFVNPIMNGQCSDSKAFDVKLMKRRAHILHETLAGCVQRKDYSALTKFLLPKNEYVILVRLSKVQVELYQQYLNRLTAGGTDFATQSMKGSRIFTDYQNLMKIWTHPWVLKMDEVRQELRRMNTRESEDSFIDDSDFESDASTAKESKSNDEDDADVQVLDSEDEWKPQRQTRRSAAMEKKKEERAKKDGSTKDETNKKKPTNSKKNGGDDDDDDDNSGSDKGEVVKGWKTRSRGGDKGTEATVEPELPAEPDKVSNEWWAEYVTAEDQFKLELSGKLLILAEILQMAESIGDKVLVFSQSLLSLNLIEAFLAHWDQNSDPETRVGGAQGWDKGIDYVRMDGSTSAQNRKEWAEMFNDPENVKVRLFLISTKAGSLGINLVAANRVVVFDASWNPTHDVQSIFRVYRFGQDKPVYVYRLLAQGTMEEKIYERQVTKQSLAQRVIDEHQIERHFTANDLRELYNFKPDNLDDPDRPQRPTPKLPKDLLLAEILTKLKDWVVQYHEHDSLLENKIEEELSEEERKAAWEEYEQEKKGLLRPGANAMMMMQGMPGMPYPGMSANAYQMQNAVMELDPHRIAQAIYQANPGISQEDLTQRVTMYLRDAQRQRLIQMQQQQDYRMMMERQRLMQLQLEHEQRMREAELRNNPSGLAAALLAAGGQRPMSASSALMSMLANSQSQQGVSTSSRGNTSRSASRPVSRSASPSTVAAAAAPAAAAAASTGGTPPTSK